MKEVGRCPNCGAKLPKGKHGIIKCEYCDSEFADETPIMVIDDVVDNYYKILAESQNKFRIHHAETIKERQTQYINQCRELSSKYTSSTTRW